MRPAVARAVRHDAHTVAGDLYLPRRPGDAMVPHRVATKRRYEGKKDN